MKAFQSVSVLMTALFLAGCSDPADQVHKTAAAAPNSESSAASSSTTEKEFVIRSGSKIDFVGSKVTGKHDGGFKKFAGTIKVADGKVVGTSDIRIDMNSIWSDSDRLTGHLKSPDFFDVKTYPLASFTVTGLEPGAEGKDNVTGNLELHGVTKSISFPAQISVSDDAVTVNAEFAINRKDFNINYPGKPNDLIRDHVVIKLALNATPGPAGPDDQLAN